MIINKVIFLFRNIVETYLVHNLSDFHLNIFYDFTTELNKPTCIDRIQFPTSEIEMVEIKFETVIFLFIDKLHWEKVQSISVFLIYIFTILSCQFYRILYIIPGKLKNSLNAWCYFQRERIS